MAKTQIKLSCLNKDSSQYQQKYGTVLDLSETQVFVSQYGTLLTLRSFSFSKQIKSIIKTIKSTTKTDLKIIKKGFNRQNIIKSGSHWDSCRNCQHFAVLYKKWGKGGFHIFCWNFNIVKQATISLKGHF